MSVSNARGGGISATGRGAGPAGPGRNGSGGNSGPGSGSGSGSGGNRVVPIRLVELYPILAQAYEGGYSWLRDFEDDQLMVSEDLFEIVRAFRRARGEA